MPIYKRLRIISLNSKIMKKIITLLVALGMVFTLAVPIAEAQQSPTTTSGQPTLSQLQAQINALLSLITQLQAQLAQSGGASPSGFIFTSDLTIGSTGNEVVQLQQFLVSRGFLTMPPGVAFGYFGSLTQTAVARFQAAEGISPTAGYFGPITRTRVNAIITAGSGTTPPPQGGITTPGVEGTMSVTASNAGLRSTVYEGDSRVPVLGLRISARQSDIAVQRVRLNLGDSSRVYNRILSRVYVTEGSNVLASVDLNSGTVVREGDSYFVALTGFNYIVPKDSDRTLVVSADVRSTVDSTDRNTPFTISLSDNGVRGIDGAGIDHYSPSVGSSIARSITAQASLAQTSTLRVSLNNNTPKRQEVVADQGVNNNELDRLTLLTFDLRAERDDITLTDLRVDLQKSGAGTANASSTVYLYEGSTEIDNAAISGTSATFRNLSYTIPQGSTKTLSVRTDIRNADANVANFTASIPANGIVAENTLGDTLGGSAISGSATGYEIGVRNVGSNISLVSKSVTTSGVPQRSDETSVLTATFNVRIRAVGSDLVLGTPASSTPAFGSDSFAIYRNGVVDSSMEADAISFSVPSGANTSGLSNGFRVSEGSEVTIPVTVQLRGRVSGSAITSGLYAIGLEEINWIANNIPQEVNFMAGDPDWRTTDVSFP